MDVDKGAARAGGCGTGVVMPLSFSPWLFCRYVCMQVALYAIPCLWFYTRNHPKRNKTFAWRTCGRAAQGCGEVFQTTIVGVFLFKAEPLLVNITSWYNTEYRYKPTESLPSLYRWEVPSRL